jgi:hypothetical protein
VSSNFFWTRWTYNLRQSRASKNFFVRRGLIRCPASRARSRSTARSEAGSDGPNASATHEWRSTVAYLATVQLLGRGTVAVAAVSIDTRTAGMEREHIRTDTMCLCHTSECIYVYVSFSIIKICTISSSCNVYNGSRKFSYGGATKISYVFT